MTYVLLFVSRQGDVTLAVKTANEAPRSWPLATHVTRRSVFSAEILSFVHP